MPPKKTKTAKPHVILVSGLLGVVLTVIPLVPVKAQEPPGTPPEPTTFVSPQEPQWYSLHLQGTLTAQGHPSFSSEIPNGPESMKSRSQTALGNDATLFAGIRVGALELYANPEMDQGYGLSDTTGTAGYVNGETGKVGQHEPYFRLPRLFARYILSLGGEMQTSDDGANQVAGSHSADNLTFTFGKFSVVDIFDTNSYAHDPRADFLNWSIIDMGAFDYAADAWGYSYGSATEWTQSWWTVRGGLFAMSRQPNGKSLTRDFDQYQAIAEAEERHSLMGQPGKIKGLFFLSSAQTGSYADALNLSAQNGLPPDTSAVRHRQTKPGGGLNVEQQILPDLGAFARASISDGTKEAYEFTEINRSLSGGLSLKGARWDRADDTVGLAGSLNGLSNQARQYFAAGGQGILIGDGQLPSYSGEKIIEAYYQAVVYTGINLTADYQHVINPAYDAVRGPIDFYALRLHLEY